MPDLKEQTDTDIVERLRGNLPFRKNGDLNVTSISVWMDEAATLIEQHRKRIGELESVLVKADGLHSVICSEVEDLMGAKPGSAREAKLEFLATALDDYEEIRWGKDFKEDKARALLGDTK